MITLSKSGKILLGILTFVPLVCIISYLGVFFSFFFEIFDAAHNSQEIRSVHRPEDIFPQNFVLLFGLILMTLVSSLGLLIYYIIHVMRNPKLNANNNQQLVWALIILLSGFIGNIVYFFMEIYPLPNDLDE